MVDPIAADRRRASLLVRDQGGGPVIYGKWRSDDGQVERRIGRGWLVRPDDPEARPSGKALGRWQERRGRPRDGLLTPDAARELLPQVIAEWRLERAARPRRGQAVTFARAASSWFDERGAVAGWKPTTQRNYAAMLADADATPRARGRRSRARIMSSFGDLEVNAVDEAAIRAFLRRLDKDPTLSPRSVNAHRMILSMVFAHSVERGWCAVNPVDRVPKRRERDAAELVVFSSEQIAAVARRAPDATVSAMILTAAMTGLRLGELLELRWRDVHFGEAVLHVLRSYAAGLGVTTPKGRRGRSVPLAEQVAQALARLGQRGTFIGRNDLVFCSAAGAHLDPSNVRAKYVAARDAAHVDDLELPRITFHGLRHCFGSRCAASGIDVVTIQRWMGHSSIKTTQRYMHHAPSVHDAARLSRAFDVIGVAEAAST